MLTIILCAGIILIFLAAIYTLTAEFPAARNTYWIIFWLPSALLLFTYSYQDFLEESLGYAAFSLWALIGVTSLVVGIVGLIPVVGAKHSTKSRLILILSTVIAFMPIFVYLRLMVAWIGAA